MNNNHGYNSIEEYIADINKAIPFINGKWTQRPWKYAPVNWKINRPNFLLVAWKTHNLKRSEFSLRFDRDDAECLVSKWFLKDVPYNDHYQCRYSEGKGLDVKLWGEFSNDALPYIKYNKWFLRACINYQEDCVERLSVHTSTRLEKSLSLNTVKPSRKKQVEKVDITNKILDQLVLKCVEGPSAIRLVEEKEIPLSSLPSKPRPLVKVK